MARDLNIKAEKLLTAAYECAKATTFKQLEESMKAVAVALPFHPGTVEEKTKIAEAIEKTKHTLLTLGLNPRPQILDRAVASWVVLCRKIVEYNRTRNAEVTTSDRIPNTTMGKPFVEIKVPVVFACPSFSVANAPQKWGVLKYLDDYVAYGQTVIAVDASDNADAYKNVSDIIAEHFSDCVNVLANPNCRVPVFGFMQYPLYYAWLVKAHLVTNTSLFPSAVTFLDTGSNKAAAADRKALEHRRKAYEAFVEANGEYIALKKELEFAKKWGHVYVANRPPCRSVIQISNDIKELKARLLDIYSGRGIGVAND